MSGEPTGGVIWEGTARYRVNFEDFKGVIMNKPMAVKRSWWRRLLAWMAKP